MKNKADWNKAQLRPTTGLIKFFHSCVVHKKTTKLEDCGLSGNGQTLYLRINIAFSWQGEIDHRADMRFQDENSRCLLWRRMSSNRALHPLMKPTGRRRDRNQSLSSPTHLTWLVRIKWGAWDHGIQPLSPILIPWKLPHDSLAVLKRFFFPSFGFLSVAEQHALSCVTEKPFICDYVTKTEGLKWLSPLYLGGSFFIWGWNIMINLEAEIKDKLTSLIWRTSTYPLIGEKKVLPLSPSSNTKRCQST